MLINKFKDILKLIGNKTYTDLKEVEIKITIEQKQADAIIDVLKDFSLKNKIDCTITSDGDSYNVHYKGSF